MSFAQQFKRLSGAKQVTVIPGAEMPGRQTHVFEGLPQKGTFDFDVDTPIYEGDRLEWDDRGLRKSAFASEVEVFDSAMGSGLLNHISVTLGSSAMPRHESTDSPSIVVHGSHVNIAINGSSITQQIPVAAGYEDLVDAVGQAVAVLEQAESIDADELTVAKEAATAVLEEAAKATPDRGVIKRALPTLRGVLTAAATSGAGAAASQLVSQMFV